MLGAEVPIDVRVVGTDLSPLVRKLLKVRTSLVWAPTMNGLRVVMGL